jgi:hypothetical protein
MLSSLSAQVTLYSPTFAALFLLASVPDADFLRKICTAADRPAWNQAFSRKYSFELTAPMANLVEVSIQQLCTLPPADAKRLEHVLPDVLSAMKQALKEIPKVCAQPVVLYDGYSQCVCVRACLRSTLFLQETEPPSKHKIAEHTKYLEQTSTPKQAADALLALCHTHIECLSWWKVEEGKVQQCISKAENVFKRVRVLRMRCLCLYFYWHPQVKASHMGLRQEMDQKMKLTNSEMDKLQVSKKQAELDFHELCQRRAAETGVETHVAYLDVMQSEDSNVAVTLAARKDLGKQVEHLQKDINMIHQQTQYLEECDKLLKSLQDSFISELEVGTWFSLAHMRDIRLMVRILSCSSNINAVRVPWAQNLYGNMKARLKLLPRECSKSLKSTEHCSRNGRQRQERSSKLVKLNLRCVCCSKFDGRLLIHTLYLMRRSTLACTAKKLQRNQKNWRRRSENCNQLSTEARRRWMTW